MNIGFRSGADLIMELPFHLMLKPRNFTGSCIKKRVILLVDSNLGACSLFRKPVDEGKS